MPVWVLGMFRRLAVSLYAEWRSRSKNRRYASLHDFHNLMARHNKKHAYTLVSALSPSLKATFAETRCRPARRRCEVPSAVGLHPLLTRSKYLPVRVSMRIVSP